MSIDHERVRENVRKAETEDLLDRLTVYQAGMEQEALDLIEAELLARGVTAAQIRNHEERRAGEVLWREAGLAYRCSLCERQAVDIFLGDACRRLVELGADPAHDRRRVREAALLDQLDHARLPPDALLLLFRPVPDPRLRHVNLPLLSPYTSGSHRGAPCSSS